MRRSARRNKPSLAPRAVCATCPSAPNRCPSCSKGQFCQLEIPPTCQQCPVNVCVKDPNYHGSKSGSMGGAIGGVFAALAVAAALFWIWRKRRMHAREAMRRARADAKLRAASGEKFRPGSGKAAGLRGSSADAGDAQRPSSTGGLVRETSNAKSNRATTPGAEIDNDIGNEDADDDEEEVEWTELREDGLTTFRKPPGAGDEDDPEQDLAALRRHSIGAATHLSRITEGAEDDDGGDRRQSTLHRSTRRNTVIEDGERNFGDFPSRQKGHVSGTSFSSDGQHVRSRKSQQRSSVNPFSDATDFGSSSSSDYDPLHLSISSSAADRASSVSIDMGGESSRWSGTPLMTPSRVHRPAGAPLIDLQGKPKAPFSKASSTHSKHTSSLANVQGSAPMRPQRTAELNLRLEDGSEPGKVGSDLKGRAVRNPFSDSSNISITVTSPANGSHHTASEALEDDAVGDLPTQLASSSVYNKRGAGTARRASAMTTDSVSTLGTVDYVMSGPSIVASEGPKRVQMQHGGKAQLVRSVSAIKREKEAAANRTPASQEDGNGSFVEDDTSLAASEDPFADGTDAFHADQNEEFRTASPAGTFGARKKSDSVRQHQRASDISVTMGDASLDARNAGAAGPFALALRAQQQGVRSSAMSGASLPFVDRPIGEPIDRSPTDAGARDSMSVLGAGDTYHRGADVRSLRDSNASSLRGPHQDLLPGSRSRAHMSSQQVRQSGVSIGGLSVFDGIPFQLGQEDGAGEEQQQQMDGEHGSHRAASQHVEIHMPQDAPSKIEEAHHMTGEEEKAEHARQRQSQQQEGVEEGPREASAVDDGSSARSAGYKASVPHLPLRTGVNPAFDEIRLRHELDNYPFDFSSEAVAPSGVSPTIADAALQPDDD